MHTAHHTDQTVEVSTAPNDPASTWCHCSLQLAAVSLIWCPYTRLALHTRPRAHACSVQSTSRLELLFSRPPACSVQIYIPSRTLILQTTCNQSLSDTSVIEQSLTNSPISQLPAKSINHNIQTWLLPITQIFSQLITPFN